MKDFSPESEQVRYSAIINYISIYIEKSWNNFYINISKELGQNLTSYIYILNLSKVYIGI